ncbi:MAG: NUDIX hydrolase [Candidatus Dormibacteria bacterium]
MPHALEHLFRRHVVNEQVSLRYHRDTVKLVASSLKPLMPMDDQTARDLHQIASYVDPYIRSTPLHITASAYIIDTPSRRVLVRWHSVVKNWIQVGGHIDAEDTDPLAAALREAQEETGLPDLKPLCTLTPWTPLQAVSVVVPESLKEHGHKHLDLRYLFETRLPDLCTPEHADNPVRWLTYDAAENDINDSTVLAGIRMIASLATSTNNFLTCDMIHAKEMLRIQ